MPGKYTAHHPAPPNKPGRNWVDQVGGLPKPIDAIMRALMAKGWTQSRAVATAVNHVKKTCATGRAFGGRVQVSGEARAVACAAVASWEAKKKAAKALAAGDGQVVELAFTTVTKARTGNVPRGQAPAPKGGGKKKGGGWTAEKSIARYEKGQAEWAKRKKKGKGKGKHDEEKHPRHGKGKPEGGQFAPKGSSSSSSDGGEAAKSGGASKGGGSKSGGSSSAKPAVKPKTTAEAKPAKIAAPKPLVEAVKKLLKAEAVKAPPRKKDPAKTSDAAEAGLHRIGKAGNLYVDRDGRPWKRVGTGKKARFERGPVKPPGKGAKR